MAFRRKRNVDKVLINVVKAAQAAGTQSQTSIIPAVTFPCTVGSPRICGTVSNAVAGAVGAAKGLHAWVLEYVRQGDAASTLAVLDTNTLAQPEQDVLLFGRGTTFWDTNGGLAVRHYEMMSQTKRKLMIGDLITFSFANAAASVATLDINAVVQMFVVI